MDLCNEDTIASIFIAGSIDSPTLPSNKSLVPLTQAALE